MVCRSNRQSAGCVLYRFALHLQYHSVTSSKPYRPHQEHRQAGLKPELAITAVAAAGLLAAGWPSSLLCVLLLRQRTAQWRPPPFTLRSCSSSCCFCSASRRWKSRLDQPLGTVPCSRCQQHWHSLQQK